MKTCASCPTPGKCKAAGKCLKGDKATKKMNKGGYANCGASMKPKGNSRS